MSDTQDRIIVGSEEWCAFPGLGIPAVKARVDSGARTSSLHAFNIRAFRRGGARWVSFEVHPLQQNRRTIVRCEAEVADKRVVKSSSGIGEKRYVVRTTLQYGNDQWDIELTLSNRDSMGYRMLLGREAMNGRMLVDPSASFLGGSLTGQQIQTLYRDQTREISGLQIGLLSTSPRLTSNQRILEAGEERGHRIRFYDIRHCYMKLDAEHPEVYYRGGRLLNDLDAIIPRLNADMTYYGCALVRQFESLGVPSLNSSAAIARTRDNLHALQTLLQNGLDIPTTGFADSPQDNDELIDMVNGAPMMIKLLKGLQGRGTMLAETRNTGDSLITAFRSLEVQLLVQEFIREADGLDLRMLVINNRVVASMERQSTPGKPGGGNRRSSYRAVRINAAERRLAVRAARVLNLKVAGVDVIRAARGPLLLKVTPNPGLEKIEEVSGKDIAGAMISALEKKAGWRRPLQPPITNTDEAQ
ncbi:MAG: RimK family alpha-L-glutamate ligase [Pseudohongiellaceae bacterium]